MSVYLDCNATTPLEPQVIDIMRQYTEYDFANAGSRTHEFGNIAKSAVEKAREQVGMVVDTDKSDVIFTSGATEANNLAILGLEMYANSEDRRHIITSAIEHKAVLEPIEVLASRGFEITLLQPNESGVISPYDLAKTLTDKTVLVSLMQANNETGVIQPLEEYASVLEGHEAYFHVDAAQGYGKEITALLNRRIDLISCCAHKLYGPKGIGALITRRRKYKRPPIEPLMYGGGQERGLRPGTLPVHQIAGFGKAAELAIQNHTERKDACLKIKQKALLALGSLPIKYHGTSNALASTLNFSIDGVNSEAAIIALKGIAAVSNGSACTSSSYTPSHVLQAMRLSDSEIEGALRLSWCHMTDFIPWDDIARVLDSLR
ncbi:cysteine desulfurase DndA [Amphritea pacifica]|uniref:cysteine desulfurase DndA n=1 Tax=Amphritea pacifica TaxID=2811233 RepID=UPI001964A63F|nr:cysteine desulfurase DndA [Amphritea pacifica]MBN1006735.1 cysteine desulfurase DndA [Amphritea pacifica]